MAAHLPGRRFPLEPRGLRLDRRARRPAALRRHRRLRHLLPRRLRQSRGGPGGPSASLGAAGCRACPPPPPPRDGRALGHPLRGRPLRPPARPAGPSGAPASAQHRQPDRLGPGGGGAELRQGALAVARRLPGGSAGGLAGERRLALLLRARPGPAARPGAARRPGLHGALQLRPRGEKRPLQLGLPARPGGDDGALRQAPPRPLRRVRPLPRRLLLRRQAGARGRRVPAGGRRAPPPLGGRAAGPVDLLRGGLPRGGGRPGALRSHAPGDDHQRRLVRRHRRPLATLPRRPLPRRREPPPPPAGRDHRHLRPDRPGRLGARRDRTVPPGGDPRSGSRGEHGDAFFALPVGGAGGVDGAGASGSGAGAVEAVGMTDPGDLPTSSEIVFYQGEDGRSRLQVRLDGGTVWRTQRLLAELYQKDGRTINEHLQNIFEEGELDPEPTIRKFRIVRTEGEREVSRLVDHYNLEAILAVGYRVRSHRGTQFRRWATERLREYVVKGFVLDDERLKEGHTLGADYFDELLERIREIRASEKRFYQKIRDLYALSVDYDPTTAATKEFFQTVQNKLHWAITGRTAAFFFNETATTEKP